jgi:hypothetical protein
MSKTNQILERIVSFLPAKAQPIAKAIVPGVAALVAVGVNYAATGEAPSPGVIESALYTIGYAVLVFLIPNGAE